jgi:hypothetical protein
MSNKNGLITSKQTAGTADIEESSFFVLNRDPVVVDTLSANDVVANIVVSGISDVNDYLQLNAGVLDVSAGVLRLNGVPVGGGGGSQDLSGVLAEGNSAGANTINMNNNKITNVATPTDISDCATKGYADSIATGSAANWSTYPAKQAVDISGEDINNVELITALPVNGNPVVINNSYNLGSATLSQHALIVAGGFNAVGVEGKAISVAIKKEAFYTGTDVEELADINFYGLDDVGDEEEYASITTIVTDNTKASTNANMRLGVNVNSVRTNMVELDGSNNKVKIGAVLDVSGFNIDNISTMSSSDASGSQIILDTPGTLMTGVAGTANLLIRGGADRIDISNAGVNITTRKVISGGGNGETIGQYNFSGLTSTAASRIYGQVVQTADGIANGNEFGKMTLSTRRGGGMVPFVVLDGSASTVTMERGITLGGIAGRGISECAEIKNTGAIDISASGTGDITMTAGDDITITATDTLALNGADVNLNCTGVTSILNINSVLGTLIASVGAVDITAGGTTAINSTGNVTIGSLGTTSIENFNLNNSVLTKVAATADLELNNISKIENTAANIDISAANVRIDNFNINGSVLTKLAGAGDLQLNDVSRVFNNAGAIDISATQVNVENYQFTGSTLATGGANFTINNIDKLNESGPGTFINSYATLNAVGTGLTDAVGFKATTLTASSGTAAAFYSDATEAQASGSIAAGAYLGGTTANNTDGEAKGVWVQTVLGGATSGTATGVEVAGSMTGATKRGFWEHSSSANVINTFMNPVGIGKDPGAGIALDVSGVVNYDTLIADRIGVGVTPNTSLSLDVSGRAQIVTTTGGVANPTLTLESTNDSAPGVYLELYHNRANPAIGDRTGVFTFQGEDSAPGKVEYGRIRNVVRNFTTGSHSGAFDFYVANNGTNKDYMNIDGSDNAVVINPTKNIAGASFKIYDSQGVTTNNILMNADCSNANVMFKNYPQRYIYDISGIYTLTMPAGFNVLRMLAYGAGGGGGSGRLAASSCFGGGAGGGGNGVELWFDRRELFPDASGSVTFSIRVGQGGAGGAEVTSSPNNGNNGAAGGLTEVRINSSTGYSLFYQLSGGNGGSGGTNAAGTGGAGATYSAGLFGSTGRSGASSSITAQPDRVLTTTTFLGTIYTATGGSGAGGGVNSAGTTAYAGGIYVSPIGQKFFNAQDVNTNGVAGNAANTVNATAGSITTFTAGGLGTAPAVRPLTGQADLYGGGGGSASGTPFSTGGGDGGGSTAGVAGSRGSGGGGGGGAVTVRSGAGGRGSDGFVYLTFW